MLREYRLTNFKAFSETVTIPIRPLTLIFGANSSGKSSIFQSLLLLKQTLEEAKNPETALLPKGSLVDLGTYSDFVHNHKTDLSFEVGARFDLEKIDRHIPWWHLPLKEKIIGSVKKAGLIMQFFSDERNRVETRRIDLALGDEKTPILSYFPQTQRTKEQWRTFEEESRKLSNKMVRDMQSEGKDADLGSEYDDLDTRIGRFSESEGKGIEINSKSVFWRYWFNFVKTYLYCYILIEATLHNNEVLKSKREADWIRTCKETIDRCTSSLQSLVDYEEFDDERAQRIIDLNIKVAIGDDEILRSKVQKFKQAALEGNEYIKYLKNYQFEAAMKDLKESFRYVSPLYENFLLTNYEQGPGGPPFSFSYYSFEYPQHPGHPQYESIDGQDISPITRQISSNFRKLLENLVYLGPLRSRPERIYEFSGDTTDYVGQSGEHMASILFQRPELVKQINEDLERLKVKYQLKVSKLQYEDAGPSNIFSLRLVDKAKVDVSLSDVGFGISQVLPVVVQSRLSEKKTLLIEQPEIHLHPAHQAELGDMFIQSALGEQKNTLLLETHSEHLILRILRRIRETNDNELPEGFPHIRPKDVAVLYVQQGENGAQVIEIPVTEDGDFARPWPEGFFDERVEELF